MKDQAFAAIIQFLPDAARLEAANIGLVLLDPGARRFESKLVSGVGRVQRFFGSEFDGTYLADAKRAFDERLKAEVKHISTETDLREFASKMGNQIRLTSPRAVVLSESFETTFEDLYHRLVAEPKPERSKRSSLGRRLRSFFDKLPDQTSVFRNRKIKLPEVDVVEAPYAYLNGTLNLVKPIGLGERAKDEARSWLLVDHLLSAHAASFDHVPKIEVVLARADNPQEREQRAYCEKVLANSKMMIFFEDNFQDFEAHVSRGLAHR